MQIEDLLVVLKVAEFKSITAAALSLDILPATASAAVKRVETRLNTPLFIRSTRSLKLSPAGEKYLPQCQQALELLEQAKQGLKTELGSVDGELRISVMSDLGRNFLTPWLDEFLDLYPEVSLKLHASDSTVDFYRDPVDIAIRYGKPVDSNLYGFKLSNVPRLLCASQDYFRDKALPQHPHELVSYNGLFYQLYDLIHNLWEFKQNGETYKIKMNGNRASNDGDLVRRWCLAGNGLAVKSCLDISEHLLKGEMINVMPGFIPTPTELWLIYPSRQSLTPAVRLLRDHVQEKCSQVILKLRQANIINHIDYV